VGLVLAIDPDHRHTKALSRMAREFAGHDIVVAGSCEEALASIDRRVPDLVLFPLLLAASEESTLMSRLRVLSGKDPVQTLTIPLLAAEAVEEDADNPRWFYWFKPRSDAAASSDAPETFARDIRTHLNRERPTRRRPLTVDPVSSGLGLAIAQHAGDAGTTQPPALAAQSESVMDSELPSDALAAAVANATSEEPDGEIPSSKSAAEKGRLVAAAAAGVTKSTGRAAAGIIGLLGKAIAAVAAAVRWAASVDVPGARWAWYVTPVFVIAAGVTVKVGLPYHLPWPSRAAKPGIAEIRSVPDGSEVLVDGSKVGVTPLTASLSAGTHEVEFRYHGASRTVPLEIGAGESTSLKVDWKRTPTAHLRVTSDPSGATIMVDGKNRGVTPATLDDLAAGQHVVTFTHAAGTIRRTVKLKANENGSLNASIYSGWLAVFAPIDLQISESGALVKLDEHSRVMLSAGHHDLQFTNRAYGYKGSEAVDVRPGEITVLSVALPKTAVTVTASQTGEVWIDGTRMGETPLVDVPIELGMREIVVKNPTFGERRVTASATVKPLNVNVDFSKP
jgi:hypothetical protein